MSTEVVFGLNFNGISHRPMMVRHSVKEYLYADGKMGNRWLKSIVGACQGVALTDDGRDRMLRQATNGNRKVFALLVGSVWAIYCGY